jgi:hypothetical protein
LAATAAEIQCIGVELIIGWHVCIQYALFIVLSHEWDLPAMPEAVLITADGIRKISSTVC